MMVGVKYPTEPETENWQQQWLDWPIFSLRATVQLPPRILSAWRVGHTPHVSQLDTPEQA